jgi:hypothetical protein
MEVVRAAHRTQRGRVDTFHAGFPKLGFIGRRQIEMRSTGESELDSHLRPYLITADPNAGPDGRYDVGWSGAVMRLHRFHGPSYNRLYSAAPSGMHGGNRPLARINKKDRDTISSFDGDSTSRSALEQSVTLAKHSRAPACLDAPGGMDLLQCSQGLNQMGNVAGAGTESVY